MRIGRLGTFAAGLAIAGSMACTSPTLPLPPPALPTVSLGSEPGTFHLKSEHGAMPNALIIVVNRNATLPRDLRVEGTIADPQGSWELDLVANTGDFVDVAQEDGTSRSSIVSVELK